MLGKFTNSQQVMDDTLKYQFNLNIGDWSGDGHGKCKSFILDSNVSVIELRKMYFGAVEKTDLSPEDICCEYQDNSAKCEDIEKLGLDPNSYIRGDNYDSGIGKGVIWFDEEMFVKLFIDYMMIHNVNLSLKIHPLESFNFYGFDAEGKHIGFLGAGLFV